MSIFFKEDNSESAKELFDKKSFYNTVTDTDHPNLVDFEFAEKALYGRVDRLYRPINLKDYFLELKRLPSDGDTSSIKYALNFVVDAFEQLRRVFAKKAFRGEIATDDKFLSQLTVGLAYQNPVKLYNQHISSYSNAFEGILRNNNIHFLTFDEFVRKLFPFLKKSLRKRPFTYPAFTKSTYCPIHCTGFVIDISDNECDNDLEKIELFYKSPNWRFYLESCNNFGFMVDKNNPWRLVADIGSAEMLARAERYGIRDTDEILNIAFQLSHRKYIENFKVILFDMYNRFKKNRITKLSTIKPDGERIVTEVPTRYSLASLIEQYGESYFLKLYCMIRFEEEESHFSESEKFRIIDNLIELSKVNLTLAYDNFETILGRTFDYRGSLSYISNSLDKTRE